MAELKQRGYQSALVPILGTRVDIEAMARAAKLVGPDGAIEAVYVLKVPEHLPLNGGLDEQQREAWQLLAVARLQAKIAGCRVHCRLIRARSPGRAIVEEALERRTDLIYVSTKHAPSEKGLLSATTRYVLAHRPCRVILEHDPTTAVGQSAEDLVRAEVRTA